MFDSMAGTGDGSDLSSRPSGDQGRRAGHTVLEEKYVDDYSIEKVIEWNRFEMCALRNTRKGSLGEYSPSFSLSHLQNANSNPQGQNVFFRIRGLQITNITN